MSPGFRSTTQAAIDCEIEWESQKKCFTILHKLLPLDYFAALSIPMAAFFLCSWFRKHPALKQREVQFQLKPNSHVDLVLHQ